MKSLLLSILLTPSPKVDFTADELQQYQALSLTVRDGQFIDYQLQYPKFRFLQYLSCTEQYVFHGSNNQNIDEFEPRDQTLYNGNMTKAVFATTDPQWAIFFAAFNRGRLVGSFRNGCIVMRKKKYHFYSINESTAQNKPWTDGMIYILPREKFKLSGHESIQFDEWICNDCVAPIGMIKVNISDFYFKNKIAVHKDDESLFKTWIYYKARTLLNIMKKAVT